MTDWLVPDWPAAPAVLAVSTTRTGGVSTGALESMNLGAHVDDSPAAVADNRRRLIDRLGLDREPAWLRQVHGTAVINADGQDGVESPPVADAAWSRTRGTACVVMTADCLPVLLAAEDGGVVGAAHAGWRGLVAGVIEATVDAMQVAPSTLVAWLGPAISQAAFEVGGEVREAFLEDDAAAGVAFERNERGRWQADLYALARQRLLRAGISGIYGGGLCTYNDPARFFSYRRDPAAGRMATLIARKPL